MFIMHLTKPSPSVNMLKQYQMLRALSTQRLRCSLAAGLKDSNNRLSQSLLPKVSNAVSALRPGLECANRPPVIRLTGACSASGTTDESMTVTLIRHSSGQVTMKRDGITPLFPAQQWQRSRMEAPVLKDNHCCSVKGLCGKGAGSRPRTIRESKVLLPKGLFRSEETKPNRGVLATALNGHSKAKENPYVY
jgi:hypothetical protein